jgi:hypothetical protein
MRNAKPVGALGIGGFSLSGGCSINAEAAIKGGSNFFGIEKCPTSDLVEREKSLRLPFAKSPKSGTGGFTGEHDSDAVLCADELLRCGHRPEDAADFTLR